MRNLLLVFASAAAGAVVGSVTSGYLRNAPVLPPELRTKELVIVGENGRPAARLAAAEGQTVLQFYNPDSSPRLTLGIDKAGSEFLDFFGANGHQSAALVSLPNQDSALYLGDYRWQARVILGALNDSDVPSSKRSGMWGLFLQAPDSRQRLFSAGVFKTTDENATAGISILRENGKLWTAPSAICARAVRRWNQKRARLREASVNAG